MLKAWPQLARLPKFGMSLLNQASKRSKCWTNVKHIMVHKDPRCCPFPDPGCSTKRIKRDPCRDIAATKAKQAQEEPYVSMWEERAPSKKYNTHSMWVPPDFVLDDCINMPTRFDDLYWAHTDKSKRKFARTWSECPKLEIKPRIVCAYERQEYPQLERRPRKKRPKTACPNLTIHQIRKCKNLMSEKCFKIKLKYCKTVRDPPRCFVIRKGRKCKKLCTPSPSFSECIRDPVPPLPPRECGCLKPVNSCDFYAYAKKFNIC